MAPRRFFQSVATRYLSDRWFIKSGSPHQPCNPDKVTTLTRARVFCLVGAINQLSGKLGPRRRTSSLRDRKRAYGFRRAKCREHFPQPEGPRVRRGVSPGVFPTSIGPPRPFMKATLNHSTQRSRHPVVVRQHVLSKTGITFGGGSAPMFISTTSTGKAGKKNPAAVAPLASLTCSVRLSEHWIVRAVFDRVTSNYNRDSTSSCLARLPLVAVSRPVF